MIQRQVTEIRLNYTPLPKQRAFHGNPAKYRFFGGGWGNGKTSAGCGEAFALAVEFPGCTGLVARKTRPELRATTQHQFFNGGGGRIETDWTGIPKQLIRGWNKTEQRLELINGSIIHFWPLDDPDKLSNLNLGWFLIDQGEEVAEDMFQMLKGRLRQQNAPRCGIILFNPNGHDWIWRRCKNRLTKEPESELIHATPFDNPNLPRDFMDSLMGMPRAWIERFVYGSFDVLSGQIWPEFDPDVHVIKPFLIPEWYEMVESIDHGRRNPTSVLEVMYANIHGHDYAFAVYEHLKAGQLVGYHAEKILRIREELARWPIYTVIDASAAQQDPNTGRSVMDEYMDYGVLTVPSGRHLAARINRVADWLRLDPRVPHPITGRFRPEGYPRLYIFETCPQLIEHVSQYQWRKKRPTQEEEPRERPLEKDDHDVDSLGYNLETRPIPGFAPEGTKRGEYEWYWEKVRARMDAPSRSGHTMLGTEA
jgi:phage terminase large subunit